MRHILHAKFHEMDRISTEIHHQLLYIHMMQSIDISVMGVDNMQVYLLCQNKHKSISNCVFFLAWNETQ